MSLCAADQLEVEIDHEGSSAFLDEQRGGCHLLVVLTNHQVGENIITHLNPLTPRVKPWITQSFLTYDFMDTTLKCDHSLESC